MKNDIDIIFLKMAQIWSENSYAIRKKVGALIVKNGNIISSGYNGMPKNFPNECEHRNMEENLVTNSEVLHAESNAILKLAKSTNSSEGSTLYLTLSPCLECSKLIIQSGITKVVYVEEYRNLDGLNLLKKANIELIKKTI
jgi:dCMP deaminase